MVQDNVSFVNFYPVRVKMSEYGIPAYEERG